MKTQDWLDLGRVALLIVLFGTGLGLVLYYLDKWRLQKRLQERNRLSEDKFLPLGGLMAQDNAPVAQEPEQRSDESTARSKTTSYLPLKLSHLQAYGRLSDGDWEALQQQAAPILDRLNSASQWLLTGKIREAENICLVALQIARQTFGKGEHWLETLILGDLALFCYHADNPEGAEWRFEQAEQVAARWLHKYSWLSDICSKNRQALQDAKLKKAEQRR